MRVGEIGEKREERREEREERNKKRDEKRGEEILEHFIISLMRGRDKIG